MAGRSSTACIAVVGVVVVVSVVVVVLQCTVANWVSKLITTAAVHVCLVVAAVVLVEGMVMMVMRRRCVAVVVTAGIAVVVVGVANRHGGGQHVVVARSLLQVVTPSSWGTISLRPTYPLLPITSAKWLLRGQRNVVVVSVWPVAGSALGQWGHRSAAIIVMR